MKPAQALINRLLEAGEDINDFKEFLLHAMRAPGLVQSGSDRVSREDAIEANVELRKFFRAKGRERWLEQFEWILKEVHRSSSSDSATFGFEYWPKGGEVARHEHEDHMSYDVRRFRTPKAALADWREHLLDTPQRRYAYRGMSMQEWTDAQQKGFIKSHGRGNFVAGKYADRTAYTSFSTDWGQAHSYAGPSTAYYDTPTRRMPGVIVAVPIEATQPAEIMGVGSFRERAAERIPVSDVVGVWILTPVEYSAGTFDLRRDAIGRLDDGSRSAPYVNYAVVPQAGIALDT